MLPPILCEQLCSLNPNVDRLAYSCIWKMKANGTLVNEAPYFGRTVIRSCAKLDYATAQRMIDGIIPSVPSEGVDPDEFLKSLSEDVWETNRRPIGQVAWECSRDVNMMHSIAKNRRAIRHDNGAMILTQSKLSFRLDDNGNPCSVAGYPIRESNKLIEEYMLLANFFVAQEMLSRNGGAAFLRNHESAGGYDLEGFQSLAKDLGVTIDVSTQKALQRSLFLMDRDCESSVSSALSSLLLSTMKRANYIVAGQDCDNWPHSALAIPYYTHFTSPIRRYVSFVIFPC